MIESKNNEVSTVAKKVEVFALNLVHLIRGVRIYPNKHPTLLEVAKNVLNSVPFDSTGSLTIGVTSKELVVSGEFIAGKATPLASMLHARKVLQIFWTKEATLDDVWGFARVISTLKLEGQELRHQLRSEVFTIDIEPLKLDQIHSEITDAVKDSKENPERRRRQAWLALMSHEAPTEQLAIALASEEFWEIAKEEWTESGFGDSEGFTKFLLMLGERLEDALSLLPEGQREDILNYLAQMGKLLSVRDLVRIVGREGQESKRLGLGKASLLKEIDGERFIDLLAGLAALGEQGTHRFVEVYRRFAPITKTDEILTLIKSRLSPGKDAGFTAEVWKTVEDLIINLSENPFMDSEYSESLEFLVHPSSTICPEEETPFLLKDPDEYLDQLILALALEEGEDFKKRLLNRIEARVEQLGPLRVLGFIRLVDRTFPELLDSVPSLVKDLFKKGLSAITKTSFPEQHALITFAVNHEKCLLETALKALAEEEQISKRHFLVNLLSCFSSAATPTFVVKSRISPWYVARNLAIVLGQQGLPQVLRPLQALLNHPHPKVSSEALRALKRVQTYLSNQKGERERGGLISQNHWYPPKREKSYGAGCP
ncbi:MAG: HEAT repeat domain-containing protein [Syntrophaceae bacterium]|nr:HEAT repeat domain-containing protein [Syntrophaceae bacterium]